MRRLNAILACAFILGPVLVASKPGRAAARAEPAPPPLSVQPQNITPICLDRSNIPEDELHWLAMPTNPAQLATNEDYAYLSGQLIQAGVVSAADCPLGGVWPDGYATACGLARTREVSRHLQNVYDDEILAAGRSTGVPPVMMKQLIRYESQFWPVQWGLYHYGLGHLTFAGASTALTWNRELYETVAAQGTTNLPATLLSMMNAYCPTCTYGIDIPKAEDSIILLAETLLAYCKQTTQIIYNATKLDAADVVDYPTVWRLTLLNYNAGPVCAYDAVNNNFKLGTKLRWVGIAGKLRTNLCIRGVGYVDTITAPYYDFGPAP